MNPIDKKTGFPMRCADCRFAVGDHGNLECHYNAPVSAGRNAFGSLDTEALWVSVKDDDFCGQFVHKHFDVRYGQV